MSFTPSGSKDTIAHRSRSLWSNFCQTLAAAHAGAHLGFPMCHGCLFCYVHLVIRWKAHALTHTHTNAHAQKIDQETQVNLITGSTNSATESCRYRNLSYFSMELRSGPEVQTRASWWNHQAQLSSPPAPVCDISHFK